MYFILSFSCAFLNFFVFSFVYLSIFSQLQLCFLIIFFSLFFVGVAVSKEFLKQCEISRFANFHNL